MDRLRRALSRALEELSTIEEVCFVDAFRDFIAELEKLFQLEEAWLEENECPSLLIHLEEHGRALSALHQLHSRVMAGGTSEGREVVRHVLPQWLAFHMATMDLTMMGSLKQAEAYCHEPNSVCIEEASFDTSR